MTDRLTERLNQVLSRITSDDFVRGRGLGNELAFYIFDYPAEEELRVREHIQFLCRQIAVVRPDLRFVHINMFDLIIDHLRERGLLDKALEMQRFKGDEAVHKALSAPLHASKLAPVFRSKADPNANDLILVSGVGNAWPMLRTHTLLANLQPLIGQKPLVMFFPGRYDGQSLHLFGCLGDNHYYRAFALVP